MTLKKACVFMLTNQMNMDILYLNWEFIPLGVHLDNKARCFCLNSSFPFFGVDIVFYSFLKIYVARILYGEEKLDNRGLSPYEGISTRRRAVFNTVSSYS